MKRQQLKLLQYIVKYDNSNACWTTQFKCQNAPHQICYLNMINLLSLLSNEQLLCYVTLLLLQDHSVHTVIAYSTLCLSTGVFWWYLPKVWCSKMIFTITKLIWHEIGTLFGQTMNPNTCFKCYWWYINEDTEYFISHCSVSAKLPSWKLLILVLLFFFFKGKKSLLLFLCLITSDKVYYILQNRKHFLMTFLPYIAQWVLSLTVRHGNTGLSWGSHSLFLEENSCVLLKQ